MNDRLLLRKSLRVMTLSAMATLSSTLFGQVPKSDDALTRYYYVDAKVLSFLPDEELATCHSYSGGVGPAGGLGLEVADHERHFNVAIIAKFKARRFLAHVAVKPTAEDTRTRAQEIDYDLSDLNPRSLEIARDDDGRVYRLSLVPRIVESPKPRQFKASDLRLEYWRFASSPMILNDQDYIGRLNMSSAPLAWCDIPGLAKVEFSLLHLKDALPLGTLQDGVINITHEDGTTLRISDVKNGVHTEVLKGGPYRVWVRWKKPTQSVGEYQESMKARIASLKERVKSGDLSLPAGSLERLEKMRESGRIGLVGGGLRDVEEDELVESDE